MDSSDSDSASGSPNATSPSLIEQLQGNEPRAWQRVYVLYSPLVEFWCRSMHVPSQDVQDLVQDVFQTVAKSINGFTKQQRSFTFRSWLKTITRSRVIDWRRRSAGKPVATGGSTAQVFLAAQPFDDARPDDSSQQDAAEQQLTQQLYFQALQIIREHFQERTWQAFWGVAVEGKSPQDIGAQLSMQPGAVRVAKSRVLQRLRAELGELTDFHPE